MKDNKLYLSDNNLDMYEINRDNDYWQSSKGLPVLRNFKSFFFVSFGSKETKIILILIQSKMVKTVSTLSEYNTAIAQVNPYIIFRKTSDLGYSRMRWFFCYLVSTMQNDCSNSRRNVKRIWRKSRLFESENYTV